jgi:hypothetical protein
VSKFDSQLWKERAWARHTRVVSSLRAREKDKLAEAERKWFSDVLSISDLEKLVGWCGERCIDVEFVKKSLGIYIHGEKEIKISSRLKPLNQVAVLLHECGHHLVGLDDRHDRFGMGYPQTDPEVTRTFHHRLACLEEELEAWHRGWKLSQRLELNIPREEFDRVRLDCVRSYIKWSLRPGRFHEAKDD